MITVQARIRAVYYAPNATRRGPGRMTKSAAYKDAARQAWRGKYPCDCEHDVGHYCGAHGHDRDAVLERRRTVIARLARWLRWRDERSAWAIAQKSAGKAASR